MTERSVLRVLLGREKSNGGGAGHRAVISVVMVVCRVVVFVDVFGAPDAAGYSGLRSCTTECRRCRDEESDHGGDRDSSSATAAAVAGRRERRRRRLSRIYPIL